MSKTKWRAKKRSSNYFSSRFRFFKIYTYLVGQIGGVAPRDPPSNFFNFGPMSSNFLWEIEKCLKFHNFSKIMISAHQAHKSTSSNMQWFSKFDQNWGDSSNNLSKSVYFEQMSSVFLSEVQKYLYFWKIKKLLISAHQAQISTLTK